MAKNVYEVEDLINSIDMMQELRERYDGIWEYDTLVPLDEEGKKVIEEDFEVERQYAIEVLESLMEQIREVKL